MAETVSHIINGVMGDVRYSKYKVTCGADSATADVPTNLGTLGWAVVQPLQGAAMPSSRINSGVGNTALAGNLALHSATSAGSYIVIGFGPRGA
jgi:hypothetical protein